MKKTFGICHFQPLEQYPPVMNFLNCLNPSLGRIFCLTNRSSQKVEFFQNANVTIHRVSKQSNRSLFRYVSYFLYNLCGTFLLFVRRPYQVFCYETLSVMPVYLYSFCFPNAKIYLHYHEYVSLGEYEKSSAYIRFLHKLEKRLFKKAVWISQTNEDRLELFKNNFQKLKFNSLNTLANYPPSTWYQTEKKINFIGEVRFVYVGSLGFDTMYVKEFCEWVLSQNGLVSWHIYSSNVDKKAFNFIKDLNCPYIILRNGVSYFELPSILAKYDFGIVFYKGTSENFVFNIPNKLFEYYSCGLNIWCSKDLISAEKFLDKEKIDSLFIVDFTELDAQSVSYKKMNKVRKTFTSEREFQKLINHLTTS